jgi:hypothetical protein
LVSLNSHVKWITLLKLLGSEVRTPAIPAVVRCPICSHLQLEILQDYISHGAWGACRHCHFAGDMIELAAATWKLSIPATIHKLQQNGVDIPPEASPAETYRQQYVEYRHRFRELWTEAQAGLLHNTTHLKGLVYELGWRCEVPADRWTEGPARILGAASTRDVERCFMPGTFRTTGRNTSNSRLFKGGKWDGVLMIPFYDLPDRMCAAMFIGRRGDPERDQVFRRLRLRQTGITLAEGRQTAEPAQEAGLAFHPDTWVAAADWDQTLFASDDLSLAWRLQMRQFEHSVLPLPLVVWRDGPDTKGIATLSRFAWQMFANQSIVFWAPRLQPAAVRQAVATDGRISTAGSKCEDARHLIEYTAKFTPEGLLQHVRKTARPWPEVIAKHLAGMPAEAAEDFMLQLQLETIQVNRVVRCLDEKMRERCRDWLRPKSRPRTVIVRQKRVLEQEDGWILQHQVRRAEFVAELLCDAKLRIEEVIHYKKLDQTYYRGHLEYRGELIPFCDLRSEVEASPLSWMRGLLLAKGKGLVRGLTLWDKYLVNIALQFHEPKILYGTDTVGWDKQKLQFVLPRYIVGLKSTRRNEAAVMSDALPAVNLIPLRNDETLAWAGLPREAEASDVYWGATVNLLANVLAPVFNQPTVALGLVGDGAYAGLDVAAWLGCLNLPLETVADSRKLAGEEFKHDWPVAVVPSRSVTPAIWHNWLNRRDRPHNCITPLDPLTAAVHHLDGGWRLLSCKTIPAFAPRLKEFTRHFVVVYLQDLCKRKLRLSNDDGDWFLRVWADCADFVTRSHGKPLLPAKIPENIRPENVDAELSFVEMLAELVAKGQLRLSLGGYQGPRDASALLRVEKGFQDNEGLYVPQEALSRVLTRKRLPVPETDRITAALAEANVLGECRDEGWVLDSQWWSRHFRRLATVQQRAFKVVG